MGCSDDELSCLVIDTSRSACALLSALGSKVRMTSGLHRLVIEGGAVVEPVAWRNRIRTVFTYLYPNDKAGP